MKFLLALTIAATQLLGAAQANFVIYVGGDNFIEIGFTKLWFMFPGPPSCDDVLNTTNYPDKDDVSGNKYGVRCDGKCEGDAPQDIEQLEMNTKFGHFTIYKNREWGMFDLNNNKVGTCRPARDNQFECAALPSPTPIAGVMQFICDTDIRPST